MSAARQTTLRDRVTLSGAGVHSNEPVKLILHPADVNTGVCFLRTGLPGDKERLIPARWNSVSTTELCTVIGAADGASVATIEHLLSALAGLGVVNPAGVWHTADVHEPGDILSITPGRGTEHKPR